MEVMAFKVPSELSALSSKLGRLGLEGPRRAVSALSLSFFAVLYLFLSLNAPEGWGRAFAALSLCYLVAFFSVVAGWFWGRWFATGLGWSGLMVAGISLVMIGWAPALAIYGALHALIVLPLSGKSMAAQYDLQEGWRQKYRMDELGVARLRKTITRSAASLPSLILWALGPKEGQGMLFSLAALGLTIVGLSGVVRLRTWGWLAVAGATVMAFGSDNLFSLSTSDIAGPHLATALLAAAVVPFVMPAVRYVRARA
jgi:MFS family permease